MNIPKYRAKKIDSDEYVIGELVTDSAGQLIILRDCVFYGDIEADGESQQGIYNSFNDIIDPSTLSINFNDMIDSENNPIFASLSEDGKGGDMTENYTFVFCKDRIKAYYFNYKTGKPKIIDVGRYDSEKVIGIQE